MISTNYLGSLVLKYADLPLSTYDNFLLAQREQLPVFNIAGYMTTDGNWYEHWVENDFSTLEKKYQAVQYYALFDKRKNMSYFQ
ncbi:hypothetical protein LI187_15045 [bacterium 210820-DFI.6.38]|nr:hypothetical protein [bacterium 210820-DFI.6.38]